jgi:hypothetical protein
MALDMEVIAERQLELRTPSGTVEVAALLGKPRQVADEEWTCACITRFGTDERVIDIHGGDSMQALQLAMATLDEELKRRAEQHGGTLIWFDESLTSI